jgi:hypothetical protein
VLVDFERPRVRSVIRSWLAISGAMAAIGFANRAAADAATTEPSAAASEPLARHGSGFVDPLGLALFGPRLGIEGGAGRFSVAAYGRWFNAGLLAHSLFLGAGDQFGFSYGAGVRVRYYLSDALDGAHFGLATEYLRTRIENSSELIATNSNYLVPYVEAGYRLPLGGFYADASAGFGYALKLSGSVESLPGGNSASGFEAQDKSTVYGTASLDLGVYF